MASGFSLIFDYTSLRDTAGRFTRATPALLDIIDFRMAFAALRAEQIAKQFAPVGPDGAFSAGLMAVEYGEHGFAITTTNPQLLLWIRQGTGIYAGHGEIVATHGPVMAFPAGRWPNATPNAGGMFFFHSVKGQQANPWETEALDMILAELTMMMQEVVGEFGGELGEG